MPDAWPALMRLEVACAYLGDICEDTFRKVCPVWPIDMGANVLVYRKAELDAWEASLPHRRPRGLREAADGGQDAPPAVANDRPMSPVERARARAKR
ncbi:MAG: hypothetical protein JSR98_15255 [Proteobacteria bacterium]|nr:hypothetical protein [Pseudomonadota bacterium]